MRLLQDHELAFVSGAGRDCCRPRHDRCSKGRGHKNKGNNGFGNGGHDGVPGNSNKQDRTR